MEEEAALGAVPMHQACAAAVVHLTLAPLCDDDI